MACLAVVAEGGWRSPGLLKIMYEVRFAHVSTFRARRRGPDRC
jgi:hypothetical protein